MILILASNLLESNINTILHFFTNYLFQSHPDVIKAGVESLNEYGAGLSSVRFICGTQGLHKVYAQLFKDFIL